MICRLYDLFFQGLQSYPAGKGYGKWSNTKHTRLLIQKQEQSDLLKLFNLPWVSQ